ncbi:hypothetical protein PLICRDRAFT_38100 [Plicaturopsis crispa FD-325 SS-3]|nr:hypothetical protein PLICRDRAFT_38100 [Plicaturopsis crispa FD-325 SS-3]
MASVPSGSFPRFPLELERMIFEIAARRHRPDMLQLVIVARYLSEWITPDVI